ncbi:MAG: hypothetical protein IT178_11835 [Acidobacteria bacterium]|nr:hypothetical protein [Acidobacteriota bacterium]
MPAKASPRRQSLRDLLAGGDRRSVAQSERAHSIVERSPDRVTELVALTKDADWLVAMRALDLLEKFAHTHADWVQPHRKVFIGPLADRDEWEFRLQVVQALPLLEWTPRERARVVEILVRDLEHPQKFVRAWALDSLARYADDDPELMPTVERTLTTFESSESKALRTRARHIRTRLNTAGPP